MRIGRRSPRKKGLMAMRRRSVTLARWAVFSALVPLLTGPSASSVQAAAYTVEEDQEQIRIETPQLIAVIRKQGYVSGVAGGSLFDKKSGFRDVGHGLDIVDWILEPGSDEAYRDDLHKGLVYRFNNLVHGKQAKRSIEGPQICTRAQRLSPKVIRGENFVAVKMSYRYQLAAPGRKTGSLWEQTIVFPIGKRYFLSMDRIHAANDSPAMFLRIDMPGHIKHQRGDSFSAVYLSYLTGSDRRTLPSSEFLEDFRPDAKYGYRRDQGRVPQRFIRAYRLRQPTTGKEGPWLAGMTLEPSVVHEAWCHQRGYVCMIEEFGGRPIRAGESFSAAFVVGFFDTIDDMNRTYDQYAGHTDLQVDQHGWRLRK